MKRIVTKRGRAVIRMAREVSRPFVIGFRDPEEPTFEYFKCKIDVCVANILESLSRSATKLDDVGGLGENPTLAAELYGDATTEDCVLIGVLSGLTACAEMPKDGASSSIDPVAVQPLVGEVVAAMRAVFTSFGRFLQRYSSDPSLHLSMLQDVRESFKQVAILMRDATRWGDAAFCGEIEKSCETFAAHYVLLVQAIERSQRWFHAFKSKTNADIGRGGIATTGKTVYTARQLAFLQQMAARSDTKLQQTKVHPMISPFPVARTALAIGNVLGHLLSDVKANATRSDDASKVGALLELAHGAHRSREMIRELVANLFSYTESGAADFDLKTAQDAEKAMALMFDGVLKFKFGFDVKRLRFAFIAFWRSFLAYHESKGKVGTLQLLRWNYYLFNVDFERFVAFLYASVRKIDASICDAQLQNYVALSNGFKLVHRQLAISTDALVMVNEGLRANCAVFPLGAQLLFYDKAIENNSVDIDGYVCRYMEQCTKKFSRFNLIDPNATMIKHAIVPFSVKWWSESFRPFIDKGELTVADNRKLEKIKASYLAEWHRMFEILQRLLPTRSLCVESDELIDQMREILDTQSMSRRERGIAQDEVARLNMRLQSNLRLILVELGCQEIALRKPSKTEVDSVPTRSSANSPDEMDAADRKPTESPIIAARTQPFAGAACESSVPTIKTNRPEEVCSLLEGPLDDVSHERGMVLTYEKNEVVEAPSFYANVASAVEILKKAQPSRGRFANVCLRIMEGIGIAARSFDLNLPNYQWMRDAFRLLLEVPKELSQVELRNTPMGGLTFDANERDAIVTHFEQLVQCLVAWQKMVCNKKSEFTPDDKPSFEKTVYTLGKKMWPPLHPKPVEYVDLIFNTVEVRGEKLWLFSKDVLESIYDDLAYHLPDHTDLKQIVLAKARELGQVVKDVEASATEEWQFYSDTLFELVKHRDARRSPEWFVQVCSTLADGIAIAAEHRDRQLYRYRWLKFGFSLLQERPRTSVKDARRSAVQLHFSEAEAEKMGQSVCDFLVQLGAWMEECGFPDPNMTDDDLRNFVVVAFDLSIMRWPRVAKKAFGIDPPNAKVESVSDMMFTTSRVSGRLRYVNSIFSMLEQCCVAESLPKNITPNDARELVKKDYDKCLKHEFSLEIKELQTEFGNPPAIKITWGQTTKEVDADEDDRQYSAEMLDASSFPQLQDVQPIMNVVIPSARVIPPTIKVDTRLATQIEHCKYLLMALEFYRVEVGRNYRRTQNDTLLRPPEMPKIAEWVNIVVAQLAAKNGESHERITEKMLRGVLSKALGASINHIKDVLRTDANAIKKRQRPGKDNTIKADSKYQSELEVFSKRHPLYFDPRICAYWIGFSSADFVLAEKPMYKMADAFKNYQTILEIFQNYQTVSSRFLPKK